MFVVVGIAVLRQSNFVFEYTHLLMRCLKTIFGKSKFCGTCIAHVSSVVKYPMVPSKIIENKVPGELVGISGSFHFFSAAMVTPRRI